MRMKHGIEQIISYKISAKQALERLDKVAGIAKTQAVLFIVDENNCLVGSLSDGDVRRGFIAGHLITEDVSAFMFHDCRYLEICKYNTSSIEALKEQNIRFVPLVDSGKRIIKVLDLADVVAFMPVDAVIMAGGKGERLMPLTEKTPKPLLVVGNKPIIEHNIDRLRKFGVTNFNVTLGYLGDQIENYFNNGAEKEIAISYLREKTPLGTIGSLSMIDNLHNDSILIMNSDVLTNIDFKDFYDYFIENEADMCVASVPYFVNVPYAVFQFSDGKNVTSLTEKPSYTFYSNAGIYLMKRELIDFIPKNTKYDATDFMEAIIRAGKKLVSYPITNYWLDIGRMDDYQKAKEDIKHVIF
jgi:dTDP-glucose pyrophosphorylase